MFKTFRITLNIGSEIGSALESVEVISLLCDFKATYSVNCSLSQNCHAQLQITDYDYNLHFQSILGLFVPKLSSSPAVILHWSHKHDLMILHPTSYILWSFLWSYILLSYILWSYMLNAKSHDLMILHLANLWFFIGLIIHLCLPDSRSYGLSVPPERVSRVRK